MKKVKCYYRLHGIRREIKTRVYDSIAEAKEETRYWTRPKTLVRL